MSNQENKVDQKNQEFQKNDHVSVKKTKKVRCHHCKTKLGMMVFQCKCGYKFCSAHLNAHSHNCTFDYVNEKKEQLEKNNPKIGLKFETI